MEADLSPNQAKTADAPYNKNDSQQKLSKGKTPQRQEKLRLKQQRKRQAQRKAKWEEGRTESASLDHKERACEGNERIPSSEQVQAGGMSHGLAPAEPFLIIHNSNPRKGFDASEPPITQIDERSREYVLNALWYTYFHGWSHKKVCKGFTPDLLLQDTPVPQLDEAFMKAFTSLRRIVFNGSYDHCPSRSLFMGVIQPSVVDERIPYFSGTTDYTCKTELSIASEHKLIDA